MKDWRREDLISALEGAPAVRRALANNVLSRVHIEVAFTLRSLNRASIVDLLQYRDDLIQSSVLCLYDNSAKILRSWDPEAGMSLSGFIGLVVRRHVVRTFRYRRNNPAANDAFSPKDIDLLLEDAPPLLGSLEEEIDSAVNLAAVRACVEGDDLTERDRRLYRAFYVEERAASDICAIEQISQDALHQALKRIRDRIKQRLLKRASRALTR